jgi:long-chain acyl-CoA synthetase
VRATRGESHLKLTLLPERQPPPDIFEQMRGHLAERPEDVLFRYVRENDRETYSYRRVAEDVGKTVDFLLQKGIEPGDRIALLLENHPIWGIAFLAVQSAGAIAVPLDTSHSPEALARLIDHADCRLLVSSTAFAGKIDEVNHYLGAPLQVAMRGGGATAGSFSWDAVLAGPLTGELTLPKVERQLDDPVAILYTSGTTGDPKGVVLTGRNLYGNISKALSLVPTSPEDHLLSILPLYHVLTLAINFLLPVYRGFRLTFLDTLDPQKVMRAFAEERVTVFVCVPQFYYALMRRVETEVARQGLLRRVAYQSLLQLSALFRRRFGMNAGKWVFRSIHSRFGHHLRLFGVGGARFDASVERRLRNLGFQIIQAYGMTETAALITVTPVEGNEEGSVGRVLPGTEVRVDPDESGSGEVLVRGSNVMAGYWRNADSTASALQNGWLHTGDSGYLSSTGFLYLTGRRQDVIVLSSGKNIYPEEIEQHYQLRCPEIKEICVLGREDQTSAEREVKLHGVVIPDLEVLKSRRVVNIADSVRFAVETASQALPSHQRVKSFEVRLAPLPRTTTRKVKRFEVEQELRERAVQEGKAAPPTALERPARTGTAETVEARVFSLISEQKRVSTVRPEMNLELDLGFDSLERIELLSNIQDAFRCEVSDEEATEIFTVEDLVRVVADTRASGPIKETRVASPDFEVQLSWRELLKRPLRADDAEKVREVLSRKPAFEIFLSSMARLAWFPSKLLFRFRVSGRGNLPQNGPFLICPNHLSYMDPVFLVIALPGRIIRQLFFLGYTEVFKAGIMKFLGRKLKVVPVDPDRQLRQALRLAAEGLYRGLVLSVFPEGERSIDGELKPFRRGPAILAVELELPVVPVAIGGTHEVWPRNSNRIRLRPVSIAFGEPIRPVAGELHEEFAERLFRAVRELQSASLRARPAPPPPA